MSLVFWLSFGAGSIYSLRKEMNKPVGWGLPTAFMIPVAFIGAVRVSADKEGTIHPEKIRQLPKTFATVMIGTGAFFCLGHLFTKMAYPVFREDVPMRSYSKPIHT